MRRSPSPEFSDPSSMQRSFMRRTGSVMGKVEETSSFVFEEKQVAPPSPQHLDAVLRILARWLVSATRKDAPGGSRRPSPEPQIPLDVAAAPKVGLDRG